MNFHPEAVRRAIRYATSFTSVALLAAGATEQVFAAASNVLGAVVWLAESWSSPGAVPGSSGGSLHANNVAPVAYTNGHCLLTCMSSLSTAAGLISVGAKLDGPIFIQAGTGLFFANFGTVGEGHSRRSVLYTLLA